MDSTIGQPLTLKCGLTLKNRLVKAAMAECMADKSGLPTELHDHLYEEWGNGGWGMLLTGNVQVDDTYLGDPRDAAVNRSVQPQLVSRWKRWAAASQGASNTPVIMQINHPGRQSALGAGSKSLCTKNIAPSAIPMDFGSGPVAGFASAALFGTPREMGQADIDTVVQQFVDCSLLAAECGFQGVQVHAAHGYLLAAFLSAKSNRRTDAYGGSPVRRAQIVVDIIRAIRSAPGLPAGFCVGIKLNSVDHQSRDELRDCVEQLQLIVATGVDFVEISGGTYEDPKMMQASQPALPHQPDEKKATSTLRREAFFLEFAAAIRSEFPSTPMMLTGGFRTRQGMIAAVQDDHACDLIGIGRPAVVHPSLPKSIIFNPDVADDQALVVTPKIAQPWIVKALGVKAVGVGVESRWYTQRMQDLGARRWS